MPRISVYVIAFNEADKIEAALRSVKWADEIVVADSHSTDATVEIARRYTDRIIQVPFAGFGKLRNAVLDQLTGDWIFSLDADERCTAAAADEIRRVASDPGAHDAYLMPRRNYVFGRWIRHSGYFPDYRQPQLFRRGHLRYTEDAVHETYVLEGSLGVLREPIAQVPFRDLAQMLHKMQRYSTLGVQRLTLRGGRPSMWRALLHGSAAFLRHYVLKLGVLDGWAGFVIAFANFEGTFYRYAKHVEQQRELIREPALPDSFRDQSHSHPGLR
ncbi:MAG TPA: glycosyltransferase family 2 protein [Burkholderiaceae bacterium]|nr:glycosyltransferase family 2 protein [Burkholderiaceae bacterium]